MENVPTFMSLFFAILPLFLVGVLGVYFRKHGGMAIHADETMLWLLINLFTPCLIVDSFLGNKALDDLGTLSSPLSWGFQLSSWHCHCEYRVSVSWVYEKGATANVYCLCLTV